ncbi:MAG: hypothetical protein H7Y89_13490 [Steroidobacteraceae bacterium]|nr:hypothetical protein [Steroidobacteraceae bacterium]
MNSRRIPLLLTASALLAMAGCAKVIVRPEGELPRPLIVQTPAKVGVVVTPETGNYTHKESRASVDYEAQLGVTHKQLVSEIFKAEFTEAKMFDSVDAARLEPGLLAIFEPRIEQFSFANAKETGGIYCAVTIRYQIRIYAPGGELVDNLTLTGYGSGPAPKIGNGEEELAIAGYAAMRDAAAKFLTQFPLLEVAKPLLVSQPLVPKVQPLPGSPEAVAMAAEITIEAVPINDVPVAQAPGAPAATSDPPSQAPPPSQLSSPFPATLVSPTPSTSL